MKKVMAMVLVCMMVIFCFTASAFADNNVSIFKNENNSNQCFMGEEEENSNACVVTAEEAPEAGRWVKKTVNDENLSSMLTMGQ